MRGPGVVLAAIASRSVTSAKFALPSERTVIGVAIRLVREGVRDVDMRVDQTRQQGRVAEVYGVGVGWGIDVGADADDLTSTHVYDCR